MKKLWTEQVKELYDKKKEKWRSCMETWRIYKESEEFLWKNDEFVWKSERNYMAQRYSKYSFFDVNCILSILFQVQFWGCPGKPKFQFHILCGWRTLYIYICIYIYTIYICLFILIHMETITMKWMLNQLVNVQRWRCLMRGLVNDWER